MQLKRPFHTQSTVISVAVKQMDTIVIHNWEFSAGEDCRMSGTQGCLQTLGPFPFVMLWHAFTVAVFTCCSASLIVVEIGWMSRPCGIFLFFASSNSLVAFAAPFRSLSVHTSLFQSAWSGMNSISLYTLEERLLLSSLFFYRSPSDLFFPPMVLIQVVHQRMLSSALDDFWPSF